MTKNLIQDITSGLLSPIQTGLKLQGEVDRAPKQFNLLFETNGEIKNPVCNIHRHS